MKTNKGLIFFTTSSFLATSLLLIITVKPNVCQRTLADDHPDEHLLDRDAPGVGGLDEDFFFARRTLDDDATADDQQHPARLLRPPPPPPAAHRRRRHRSRPNKPQTSTRNSRSNTIRVSTTIGEIEGQVVDVNGKKVYAFLGVPFAEPPVGDLRFKPPVPFKPRTNGGGGVFRADKPAKSCFQGADLEYPFRGADMWNAKTEKTEDCLYLNLWVPADSLNTTVMVWLFGGGFWYGSSSLDIYNGLGLAAEGKVIVVTPNYRLGAFGFLFLDDPEVPGNMGLLDQQMALKWIRDNIAAFNGDPNKVSLFGESAGAASIVAHMVADSSWPLFHNGILQSGSLDNPWSMDSPTKALARSQTLVKSADCDRKKFADTLQCLRNKTAAELDAAMWTIPNTYLEFPLVIVSRDRGGFFSRDAYESLRLGRYRNATDLMFGINQDEGTFWMAYYDLKQYFHPFNNTGGGEEKHINASRFTEAISNVIMKNKPNAFKSAALWEYRNANCQQPTETQEPQSSPFYREQLNQLIGDYFFTCDSLWLADEVVRRAKGRVHVYHFEQRISNNPWPRWMGVMHGYEIEYVFGLPLLNQNHYQNFFVSANNGANNGGGGSSVAKSYNYTAEDRVFSKEIIQYWTSFAKTGVPSAKTGSKKPQWPPYKLDDKAWYVLKARNNGAYALYKQKESECRMWRSIRDIEYQLYQAKQLSGAAIPSFFRVWTLLVFAAIGRLLQSSIIPILST